MKQLRLAFEQEINQIEEQLDSLEEHEKPEINGCYPIQRSLYVVKHDRINGVSFAFNGNSVNLSNIENKIWYPET
ncbi:MAG: hypothetical protein MJK04_37575 [Psychrosphaera sp.]|nr:hypothetical protein [Psychrosphaera sp.]